MLLMVVSQFLGDTIQDCCSPCLWPSRAVCFYFRRSNAIVTLFPFNYYFTSSHVCLHTLIMLLSGR